ncbi:MAG: hypothetical protein EOM24_10650 [Chloroflexia bacterium]|nr:hypothetical protein [Chloroflexia bacterium]
MALCIIPISLPIGIVFAFIGYALFGPPGGAIALVIGILIGLKPAFAAIDYVKKRLVDRHISDS